MSMLSFLDRSHTIVAEKMRARTLSRHGEQAATVVVIQGDTKETLRL